MKFVFLLLALGLLLLPLVCLWNKQLFGQGNFKAALGASLVAAIVGSTFAVIWQLLGLLVYDAGQTVGIALNNLPLEQYLLNFSFSLAAVSVYLYLNVKFPKNDLQKYSLALSNLLLGLCIAFLFFGYNKWYTLLTFATLLITLFLIEYVSKLRFMYRAYRAFALMLVPFCLVYGILFWKEVLKVAQNHLSGMFIVKIPVENYFGALWMMLLAIYMFEFFKSKQKR